MSAWQDVLFARRSLGVQLTLDAVLAGWAALGRPAAAIPCVHVVGTNGKGSTSAMVAHALARRGRRVGLYTSPHLHRVGERIQIAGGPADDDALAAWAAEVLAAEARGLPRPLTFFEILTLAALVAFERAGVEVMVLEAGLGGRLDATRVVPARVTLITPIDLDHQAYLGETVDAIAAEKAAVMAAGAPTFSAPQRDGVVAVLRAAADAHHVPLAFVEPLPRPPAGLPGEHQRVNAALALAGARALDPALTAADLDGVSWPARCERRAVGGGSAVFDASHNPHGVLALVTWLSGQPVPRRAIAFGCLADKDAPAMLALLRRLDAPLWLVPPAPGAYPLDLLAGPGDPLYAGPDDPSLHRAISELLGAGGELVICGSHALVGQLRAELLHEARDRVVLSDPLARTTKSTRKD